jgi:hypothetical protein
MTTSFVQREPCFFTLSNGAAVGYNTPDRERWFSRNGKRIREKIPQAGHQGDYDQPIRMRGEGYRWISVVHSDGNVIRHVLTNGAGDMDPNSPYAQERRQKARALGWFPFGSCPVAMLRTGSIHPSHFVDQSLVSATPCEHGTCSRDNPCPHAIAERDARMAAAKAAADERALTYKSQADKQLAEQREHNAEMLKLQADLVQQAGASKVQELESQLAEMRAQLAAISSKSTSAKSEGKSE